MLLSCAVPFSSALVADFSWSFTAHAAYAANIALVAATGFAQVAHARRTPAVWTDPPSARAACRADCLAAVPGRKVRVIPIDGRAWPQQGGAPAPRTAAAR